MHWSQRTVSEIEPAYGREYKRKADAQKDLDAGKDFVAQPSGKYVNAPQLRELGMRTVILRYKQRRQVTTLKVPTAEAAALDERESSECQGHESTVGPAGVSVYCDGSCRGKGS